MGELSKIQWTDHTFNPWIGCTRVSPGCVNCYAEAQDRRWRGDDARWGPKAARTRTTPTYWRQPHRWNAQAKAAGVRARVFCASLADVFDDHPSIEEQWREDLWVLIDETPHLDWLLLTKRPQNIPELVPDEWGNRGGWPGNIWLGTTVEDQQRADERIPLLLEHDVSVRFLSVEPQIGPVDLTRWILPWNRAIAHSKAEPRHVLAPSDFDDPIGSVDCLDCDFRARGIHWVIVGGESGRSARPFHVEWAHSIVDQCRESGTAVFVKQLGAVPVMDEAAWRAGPGRLLSANNAKRVPAGTVPLKTYDTKGGDPSEWPVDLRIRQFPEVTR